MANELITLDEARSAVNMTGTGHDAELALWIGAVSRRIDALCGPVVVRAVTELHDGGRSIIRPRTTPVDAVTSLSEYDDTVETTLTAESNVSHPAEGYLLERESTHNVVLRRRSSGSDAVFAPGRRNVSVTFQAGRYADTASVDELFKLAVGAIMRRLWSREQSAWNTGGDPFSDMSGGGVRFHKTIDPMVQEFLADELYGPAVA